MTAFHTAPSGSLRALVVENSEELRQTLASALAARGHDVVVCGDLEAGWAAWSREPFPLVVLDRRLPDGDGLALCRRLRAAPGGRLAVVLVLAGDAHTDALAEALAAGASDFLARPFTTDELATRLAVAERRAGELAAFAQAEDDQGRSEAWLRALLVHGWDMVSVLDADGVRRYVSPACERILGYAPDQLLGLHAAEIDVPEDAHLTRAFFNRLAERPGTVDTFEVRVRHRDGSVRWLEVAAANRLADPEVTGIVANSRDVTARKETEAALAAERDILRTLMEHVPDFLYVKDAASRFVRANWTATRFLGQEDPADLVGKTDFEFFPEDLARAFTADEQEVVATGMPLLNRLEPQDAAGTAWCLTSTVPIKDADGRVTGLVGISRDVTERRRAEEALRQSEARQRALLDAIPDLTFRFDRRGTYLDVQAHRSADHAVTPDTFLGKTIADVVPTEVAVPLMTAIERAIDGRGVECLEYALELAGERRVFEARLAACGEDEVLAVVRDVTERRLAEDGLRAAEARFRALVEQLPAVVFVEEVSGGVTRLRYVSPRVEMVLGFTRAEYTVAYPAWAAWVHPDDRERVLAANATAVGTGEPFRAEYRHRRKDGRWIWVGVEAVRLERADDVDVWQGILFDVTARKQLEERLAYQATHDPLTGLPNRALLAARLSQALSRAARRGRRVAVLFVDLDDFKVVNDTLGHEAGDELLVAVAGRLSRCVREGDTVARLGGDEFTLLLEDLGDGREASIVAERVMAALRPPVRLAEREVTATPSIGIAIAEPGDDAAELLRRADVAMYRAKRQGKARCVQFDAGMDAASWARLDLEAGLRRAIGDGQLRLHYQPVVRLATGQVTAVEALLRWDHPIRGLLPPDAFLPLAEESGLLPSLGRWVLMEACRQAQIWRSALSAYTPPLVVGVNVSARELREDSFIAVVRTALDAAGLEPEALQLEVAESGLIDDLDDALAALRGVRSLGVGVALDDFGTGYAGLGYLRRLPVDALKLDRSFVAGLAGGHTEAAIVRAVVQLGRELDLDVVAKGIETESQLEQACALGVHLAQGFLLSSPLPAEEVPQMLGAILLPEGSAQTTQTRV
jgi:diguanylate cyclase (GGDEF)-like protein/PAS domain S-box-containing protein